MPDELGPLEAWAADARAREAAAERSRQRWLERAAGEDATLTALLAGLRDAGDEVVVTTTLGRRHRGRVRAVGPDVVALTGRHEVLIARTAVTAVRPVVAHRMVMGPEPKTDEVAMAIELAGWADDRAMVEVGLVGGELLSGEVGSVGVDVVILTLTGPDRPVVYLALGSLSEVSRLESG